MKSTLFDRAVSALRFTAIAAVVAAPLSASMALVPQSGFTDVAEAATNNLPRYSIAKKCRMMKREGLPINWRGIATGKINSIGGPRNRGTFFVRACFETRSECERFVNNVGRYRDVVFVRAAYCVQQ